MRVNSTPTFLAGGALARYLRVKLSAGVLVVADAGDNELGTLDAQALAANQAMAVIPSDEPCVRKAVAAGAINQFANVYRAAGGKISATANGPVWGVAMQAASGDGSEINVLRSVVANAQSGLVEAHTVDDTLTAAEMNGSIHTSVGAAGTVVLTLPPATVGLNAKFAVGAVQELRLDPDGTETISLPSTGVPGAAGKYLTANAIGETVELVCCSAGSWRVFGFTGTWTAEA